MIFNLWTGPRQHYVEVFFLIPSLLRVVPSRRLRPLALSQYTVFMPTDQPWNVYREQLSSLYHGTALWEPEPVKGFDDKVSIGDVGYVYNGSFCRMFNVKLPWDDPLNQKISKDQPENYKAMDPDLFAIHTTRFKKGDYYSPRVVRYKNSENKQAHDPRDAEGFTYECKGPGALLSLPHDGHRESLMREKPFEEYIRDNVGSWFDWSRNEKLPAERIEDLILVTECTLVTLSTAVAFIGRSGTAKIALVPPSQDLSGQSFELSNFEGDVAHNCSYLDSGNQSHTPNQCVFIKGFRAKRVIFWTRPIRAAAEHLPDDPDNKREDEIQVTRVQDAPKYRDPLIGVLDYITEKCPEARDTIAITHDDDLRFVDNVETLSVDAVKQFLRETQLPVLVENGVASLRPVVDLHPALIAPNLQYDVRFLPTQSSPHLSPAILATPASNPPLSTLGLCVGDLPWLFNVTADAGLSSGKLEAYVTVQDVLLTVHYHLRRAVKGAEYDIMSKSRKAEIFREFERRVNTDPAQRGKGLRRVDFLNGRFSAEGITRGHSRDSVWEVIVYKEKRTMIISTG